MRWLPLHRQTDLAAVALKVRRLCRDDSGATSIEYGMIVALIFLAIITSVTAVASKTSAMFTTVATTMSNAA